MCKDLSALSTMNTDIMHTIALLHMLTKFWSKKKRWLSKSRSSYTQ